MTEQVIAFLVKYQQMRKLKNDYMKDASRFTLNKCMQLELELDKEAEQLLAAFNLEMPNN